MRVTPRSLCARSWDMQANRGVCRILDEVTVRREDRLTAPDCYRADQEIDWPSDDAVSAELVEQGGSFLEVSPLERLVLECPQAVSETGIDDIVSDPREAFLANGADDSDTPFAD